MRRKSYTKNMVVTGRKKGVKYGPGVPAESWIPKRLFSNTTSKCKKDNCKRRIAVETVE